MGTHVPFIASWKGKGVTGKVSDDLIDFTDFYPTLAQAAGITLGKDDPIDGVSFLPQLQGKKGTPRDWIFCHYQPYWGNFKGTQFARTQTHKLYPDGRFYKIPSDLKEQNKLAPSHPSRQTLSKVLESAPPATTKGTNKAKERPTYPDWKLLSD
ncbi:hypothetical protein N9961_00780 [bacterium]|nr:hypothetical protein [bacterium]